MSNGAEVGFPDDEVAAVEDLADNAWALILTSDELATVDEYPELDFEEVVAIEELEIEVAVLVAFPEIDAILVEVVLREVVELTAAAEIMV